MTAAEQESEQSIRERAYGYWQQAGELQGRGGEFWQQAQTDEFTKKPTAAE
jgi:hypothetical protein